jgi:hypothetical protein
MAVVADHNGAAEAAPQVPVGANQQPPNGQAQQPADAANDQIGGMSTMRGLIVYGAVLVFAGLFIDFMVLISRAHAGVKPSINGTLISAAAALSGVLGSAFALKIGIAPSPANVNQSLSNHLNDPSRSQIAAQIRRALSLEPSATTDKSWPLTVGIWVYGIVASATVVVYILNQNETPSSVKALAVTFGGYVLALLNMAYGLTKAGN